MKRFQGLTRRVVSLSNIRVSRGLTTTTFPVEANQSRCVVPMAQEGYSKDSSSVSAHKFAGLAAAMAAGAMFFSSEADASCETRKRKHHQGSFGGIQAQVYGRPRVIFVLGGPGAGKGTQCAKIVEDYGFTHLSAGELLRQEMKASSEDAELIKSYINEGKIVPVEITVRLLKKAMQRDGNTKFLVDGFPRNFDNVDGWNRVMGEEAEIVRVLFYDTDEKTMEERIQGRAAGGSRSDDNTVSIRKRFRTFLDSTKPVVKHFEKQGKVTTIPAGGPIDQVYEHTQAAIEPIVRQEVAEVHKNLLRSLNHGDHDVLRFVDYGPKTIDSDLEFLRLPLTVTSADARVHGRRAVSGCHFEDTKTGEKYTEFRSWRKVRGLWICVGVNRLNGALPLPGASN